MTIKSDSRKEAVATGRDVEVETLEETMDEVVETLAVAERAAEFVRSHSQERRDRERAAAVQEQAEAMLDAAEGAADQDAIHRDAIDRDDRDGEERRPAPAAPDRRLH